MTYLIPVIAGIAGLAIGAALTFLIAFSGAKSKAKRIIQEAEAQGEVMKKKYVKSAMAILLAGVIICRIYQND